MSEFLNKEKEELVFLFFLFTTKNEKLALFNSFLFFKFLKKNELEPIYSPMTISKSEIYSIHFEHFLSKVSFRGFFFDGFTLTNDGLIFFHSLKEKHSNLFISLSSFRVSESYEKDILSTCALHSPEILNCAVCSDLYCDKNAIHKIFKNSTLFHKKNPYKVF